MRRLLPVLFAALAVLPATAPAGNRLLDPVTTYTNGMPLASSTSLRNHNVYYQCDPGHVGCCDGRYNRPCCNSLLHPNTCCGRWRPPQREGWHRPVNGHLADVETGRYEPLGQVAVGAQAGDRAAQPSSPPTVLPEAAPTLAPFNALQSLLPQ
ncbi:MAG: hypothetical protein AAGJ46_20800 [Planctomycetota bacterium]